MTDLVIFSLEPWDAVWRRNQYLIDGMLRRDADLRVLFVEPPRDVLYELRSGRGARRGSGVRTVGGYDGRLIAFQPTKWLPRTAGPLADTLLRSTLRRALRKANVTPNALWVNDPSWAMLVARSETPALYDMTDDWLEADRPAREHDRLVANERILMSRCAAVVACSSGLEASRRGIRPDIRLIPNAVDVARYRRPATRPADLAPGGTAVYVGTLHEDRLDVELVIETGQRLATVGATCVLVGPNALSAENTSRLHETPGVAVLGPRPYAEIPAYLQHADVLIVPHVVDEFTNSLDPLKLYEYRAVGRPIVSTPVAGFRERKDAAGLTICDRDTFSENVVTGVAARAATMTVDDVPDWADRVDAYAEVLRMVRDRGASGSIPR
ncbi:glycosyltransferase [Microbacterium horticulturae]|uniref:Glycosyltransferase n=1 Tax=Microbacterium horticulturae TaxID=3028316 RepID=A0ABY8BYC9_9MICO|nr:glycosyltransferase [Microbacterium sp. KACC 23027]WEG09194.1 glycosyltransferase [Microbacterium sp. KACC 23027]